MTIYRRYLIDLKRKRGTARNLIHYRGYLGAYLKAKRAVVAGQELVDA